jgi:hypothetical protein
MAHWIVSATRRAGENKARVTLFGAVDSIS